MSFDTKTNIDKLFLEDAKYLFEDGANLMPFLVGQNNQICYGSPLILKKRSLTIATAWTEKITSIHILSSYDIKITDLEFRVVWAYLNDQLDAHQIFLLKDLSNPLSIINKIVKFADWFQIDLGSHFYTECIEFKGIFEKILVLSKR